MALWESLGAILGLGPSYERLEPSWGRLRAVSGPSYALPIAIGGVQEGPKIAPRRRYVIELRFWRHGGGALGIVLGLSCSRLGAVSGPAQGPQKGPTEGPKAAPRGPQHGSVQYLELSFSRHGGALGAVVGPSWNRLGSLPCPSRGPLGVPRRPPDISKRAQDGFMP